MSIPTQVAETVQTAHIERAPSPSHDLAPSTTASTKEPVELKHHKLPKRPSSIDDISLDSEDDNSSEIPLSVLRPHPRSPKHHFPPMPDMRFEQSYLHSLKDADTWWKVALITVRDQVRSAWGDFLPLPVLCGCGHSRYKMRSDRTCLLTLLCPRRW